MSAEWVEFNVSDIAAPVKNALVGGPFGSNLVSKDYTESGIPVIRGQNMGHGRWVAGEFAFVSAEKADSLAANTARPGDLVFTQRGTLGQVAIVPQGPHEKYIVSQSQMKLTADANKADVLFLYYLFTSPEQLRHIQTNAIQAGVPHTNLGILRDTPISLPDLDTQKEIAQLLSSLDDKIELNSQINQTLEQIAQAFFKSWFVVFEPVKAKIQAKQSGQDPERAAMRAISGKTDEEIDQLSPVQLQQLTNTAALFPDELEGSALGEIPKGWQISILGEYLDVLETGRRPKGGVSGISEGVPSVGAENIIRIGQYNYGKEKFVSREFFEKISSGVIESEDVLLYKDGGKPGEFRPRVSMFGLGFPYDEFAINEHVFRLRSNVLGQPYLYLQISHENVLFELRHKGGKAAIPGINQHDLRSVNILIPSIKLVDNFNIVIRPTLIGILDNAKQNLALARLRDSLLPKLLSGEITVNGTQATKEAVA